MEIKNRTLNVEIDSTRAASEPGRFPVSISSEIAVMRIDDGGPYAEVLSHDPKAIDLERAPLPLIESHDSKRLNVGIVDSLRIEGKRLVGEIVLGASARAKELAADIAAGIVRNLSIGYSIKTVREDRDGKNRTLTATRWQPYEASLVAVPADNTVGIFRSHTVTDEVQTDPLSQERTRVAEITAVSKRHGLPEGFALEQINRGATLDQVRDAALAVLADRSPPTMPRLSEADRSGDGFRDATTDALLSRAGIRVDKPHPAARDVSASVSEIARTCLSRAGIRHSGLTQTQLMQRAMTTSDLPQILENALHKAVRNGYETEPASHREWVRVQPVTDFREQVRPILGSAPDMLPIAELGTYTHGSMTDDTARYAVEKFGRIVSVSFEALTNDDIGAFLRVQPALGQAARRKEADVVYGLLTANSGDGQTMQDSTVLFHSTHSNLLPTGSVSLSSLSAARALLRRQTAVGGGYLSLTPRFIICPPDYETDLEVMIQQTTRHLATGSEADTPDFVRSLTVVVEPRLEEGAFYIAADPAQIDTCELGLLNMQGPVIEQEIDFNTDARRWKVRHVFGARFLDWRGVVKVEV